MKSNKYLLVVVIFGGVIFHSAFGLALSIRADDPPRNPIIPPELVRPVIPRLPRIDLEKIDLIKNENIVPEKHINYTVTFKSENEKPPSCEVIKNRLKNFETRFSELNHYTKKIAGGLFLSNSEVSSLSAIARKYLPDVIDDIDRNIQVQIDWRFSSFSGLGYQFLYVGKASALAFYEYSFEAPGVKWSGNTDIQPTFLKLEAVPDVKVSMTMSVLDFCLSDQKAVLKGLYKMNASDDFYEIKASWKADLYNQPQTGITEPVITNNDIN